MYIPLDLEIAYGLAKNNHEVLISIKGIFGKLFIIKK